MVFAFFASLRLQLLQHDVPELRLHERIGGGLFRNRVEHKTTEARSEEANRSSAETVTYRLHQKIPFKRLEM